MTMPSFSRNKYPGPFARLLIPALIAVFFSSQVFSCCLVNHHLGQFLLSAWTPAGPAAAHSCCHPVAPASDQAKGKDSCSPKTGCCLQDANQKLPELASEQATVPDMTGLLALLPAAATEAPDLTDLPAPQDLQSRSSPPVYLTQLRLLI